MTESLLRDKLPQRLFDLLVGSDEGVIIEVPGVCAALHDHLQTYYRFRQDALRIESELFLRTGQIVRVQFEAAWGIYLRYAIMRFRGASKEMITGRGDFLNYGITWDDAERVFLQLSSEVATASAVAQLFSLHDRLSQDVAALNCDV